MRRCILLRKVVDHDSKEGIEYITQSMRYTRNTNKLMYFFLLSPLLYVPFHVYVNHGALWGDYQDPYALPTKSETLREKREREAAATTSTVDDETLTTTTTTVNTPVPKPATPANTARPGGNSLWLRGGSFKESLDVKPKPN